MFRDGVVGYGMCCGVLSSVGKVVVEWLWCYVMVGNTPPYHNATPPCGGIMIYIYIYTMLLLHWFILYYLAARGGGQGQS